MHSPIYKKFLAKIKSIIRLLVFYFDKFKKNIFKTSNSGHNQVELDKKLVYSLSKSRIPNIKQLKYLGKYLSKKELLLVNISLFVLICSFVFIGIRFYINHLEIVPRRGGIYTEALIGSPKYINPLYASANDVDQDIASLVFSSLFKREKDGKIKGDLVLSYEISEDNKIYTFEIRDKVKWHNGENLSVNDIIFTFETIKNPQYKSPLRASFVGVNIEKIDENKIKFVLDEPYAAFLELLDFGILPEALWAQIPPHTASLAELNLKPIGSGPYKFKSLAKDKSGSVKVHNLELNYDYYQEIPFIEGLCFKFYPDFTSAVTALNEDQVDGLSYLPKQYKDLIITKNTYTQEKINLPQITAIFLNSKSTSAVKEKEVRQALALAVDKSNIKTQILTEDARLIHGPILPDSFAYHKEMKVKKFDLDQANKILDDAEWKIVDIDTETISRAQESLESEDEKEKTRAEQIVFLGEGQWRAKDDQYFIIRLTTVDRDENIQVAQAIQNNWQDLKIKVILDIQPASKIREEKIKTRDYETLFYGQLVGSDPDPYAFWHSSQISDPGLNIANYGNNKVDKLLEDARTTNNEEERIKKYIEFQEIIADEVPAIFMYSPLYTYVQSKDLKGFDVVNIYNPADRFSNISEWYLETKKEFKK